MGRMGLLRLDLDRQMHPQGEPSSNGDEIDNGWVVMTRATLTRLGVPSIHLTFPDARTTSFSINPDSPIPSF